MGYVFHMMMDGQLDTGSTLYSPLSTRLYLRSNSSSKFKGCGSNFISPLFSLNSPCLWLVSMPCPHINRYRLLDITSSSQFPNSTTHSRQHFHITSTPLEIMLQEGVELEFTCLDSLSFSLFSFFSSFIFCGPPPCLPPHQPT